MILATRGHGNLEVRSVWGANTAIPPAPWANTVSASGQLVNTDTATGVAAIGRAIRFWAGLVASACLEVYEGQYANKRWRGDTWQADLFEKPGLGLSAFDWLWDIAASLEAEENAFLLKTKSRGRVQELLPIPSDCVKAELDRRTGRKVFWVWTGDGRAQLDTTSVLHIRGQSVRGGAFGVSRLTQHKDPVGTMIASQRFEGSYFRNHARPDIALLYPQGVTQEQAREWTNVWNSQFAGTDNAGKAVPLSAGVTVQEIGASSLRDSQYVETRQFSVEEAARIMDTDPVLLGGGGDNPDKKAALDLAVRVDFPPRLGRIAKALRADTDLFPLSSSLYPEFRVPDTIVSDALTRSQIQHEEIQDGRLLVDEARAELGRPPLPPIPDDWMQAPGMVPQITPVGGAPNPTTEPDADETSDAGDTTRGVTVPSVELRVEQDMEPIAREMGAALAILNSRLEERDRSDAERETRDAAVADAHAHALRAIGQPNIVVNVEPTPVTVENVVNVEPIPVQLTMDMPEDGPSRKTIKVKRRPDGLIESATVEED